MACNLQGNSWTFEILRAVKARSNHINVEEREVRTNYNKLLEGDFSKYSKTGIHDIIQRYKITGSLPDRCGRTKKHKMPIEHHDIVYDNTMNENDELTSKDLQNILMDRKGITYHKTNIVRVRRKLGWVASKTKYCQLV